MLLPPKLLYVFIYPTSTVTVPKILIRLAVSGYVGREGKGMPLSTPTETGLRMGFGADLGETDSNPATGPLADRHAHTSALRIHYSSLLDMLSRWQRRC